MRSLFRFFILLFIGFTLWGCSTEFDLTAPEKDIWVVYGTLYPEDTVQYFRIAQGFLPESDAFEFARENDLSAPDLTVTLTGGGQTYVAEQVDSVLKDPEDGLFYPWQTLYKIRTIASTRLQPTETYTLSVTRPGVDTFLLTSSTRIPGTPRVIAPSFQPGPGRQACLQQVSLENDYLLSFSERDADGNDVDASSYELRLFLDYEEDGQEKTAVFGPTSSFTSDVRCNLSGAICYKLNEKEVLRAFLNQIDPQVGSTYIYDVNDQNLCRNSVDNLPTVFRIELTAIGESLTRYRLANAPLFSDVNSVRPEFTNVEGPENAIVLGVLGSYQTVFARARLSPCSEYLLNLNGTPQPGASCEL